MNKKLITIFYIKFLMDFFLLLYIKLLLLLLLLLFYYNFINYKILIL